jgi:hypothetical protein
MNWQFLIWRLSSFAKAATTSVRIMRSFMVLLGLHGRLSAEIDVEIAISEFARARIDESAFMGLKNSRVLGSWEALAICRSIHVVGAISSMVCGTLTSENLPEEKLLCSNVRYSLSVTGFSREHFQPSLIVLQDRSDRGVAEMSRLHNHVLKPRISYIRPLVPKGSSLIMFFPYRVEEESHVQCHSLTGLLLYFRKFQR